MLHLSENLNSYTYLVALNMWSDYQREIYQYLIKLQIAFDIEILFIWVYSKNQPPASIICNVQQLEISQLPNQG